MALETPDRIRENHELLLLFVIFERVNRVNEDVFRPEPVQIFFMLAPSRRRFFEKKSATTQRNTTTRYIKHQTCQTLPFAKGLDMS